MDGMSGRRAAGCRPEGGDGGEKEPGSEGEEEPGGGGVSEVEGVEAVGRAEGEGGEAHDQAGRFEGVALHLEAPWGVGAVGGAEDGAARSTAT